MPLLKISNQLLPIDKQTKENWNKIYSCLFGIIGPFNKYGTPGKSSSKS
jgi:hypothetical protein